MLKGTLQLLAGVLLLPFGWGAVRALGEQLHAVTSVSETPEAFTAGVLTYLVIHTVFHKPSQLYDTGRQTVDAAVTKTVGNRIAGGAKIVGALAYLVPFYTLIVAALYLVARAFGDVSPFGLSLAYLIGLTVGLHWFMTVDALKAQHATLVNSGYLAVVVLVTIWTCGLVVGVLQAVLGGPSLWTFLVDGARIAAQAYRAVFVQLFVV